MQKNITLSVKSTRIYPAIAPDHDAIFISLSLSNAREAQDFGNSTTPS